jgi:hypothetical protein
MRGTTSDCLSWEAVQWPDGSGEQTYRQGGRESHMTWTAPRMDGAWQVYDIDQTVWDDARLVYENGYNLQTPTSAQYEKGSAILADGREMDFAHNRNDDRDELALALPDGSALNVEVPLTAAVRYWPDFLKGAEGTFRGRSGIEQQFRLTGSGTERWERWELDGPGGTEGQFALNEDFSGSGELRQGGDLIATLRWSAAGDGVLQPVGAGAVYATASAAARDFQIDRWIGNIAALGPMPAY